MTTLSDKQWETYERDGYLSLGRLLDEQQLQGLQQRIDDMMLGKAAVDYDRMLMQLDSDNGAYAESGAQTRGHKGATLNYRKIQDLEWDPLYLEYMQRPLFQDICSRVYGPDAQVACFRAMFMNKPAGRGTVLPWHQDRWSNLDRDPQITVWTALDPATRENGCVQIIPGSHTELINPGHGSGFLTAEQAQVRCDSREDVVHLELAPGEAFLLHNWLLHSSDSNHSAQSRRAFSACYMDAATCYTDGRPVEFPTIFGDAALAVDASGSVVSH
ncbi:MAG: phytanoyl-CoA dioxygenase family protein [Lentisphaerae bacterium]|nr:phytanoyl-CoA dioxygenase family protein [Lentisphaerota bacterium]